MGLNWRRELLLLSMAGMDASWLAGWAVILMGAGRTAGLLTAWLSTFALYVMAATTARALIRRRTQRSDWIIGGLVFVSTLVFINLNLYPHNSPIDPSWLGTLVDDLASGSRTLPRELVGLLIGFFIWFLGLRLPRRHVGIRTTIQNVQIGLALIVGLAIISTAFPINVGGLVATYFASGLLSLALTRIEETAHIEGGTTSPFGRKWLITLAVALLAVGLTALVGRLLLTVETTRALLRPVAIAATAILAALGFLLAALAQYLIFPIILRLLGGRIPEEMLELPQPQVFQQEEVEGTTRLLFRPEFLNALRIVGLSLLVMIALWLVVRSFRRWRSLSETAGGIRGTAIPDSSLADDVLGYLRDRWQRLREMADIRRLLRMRGSGSIRAIYASLLTLMAAANHPRQAGQTPYEFEPTVEEALPAREAEISSITEAYVRARYGEQDVSEDELHVLREAWRRVQADGERLVEGKQPDGG